MIDIFNSGLDKFFLDGLINDNNEHNRRLKNNKAKYLFYSFTGNSTIPKNLNDTSLRLKVDFFGNDTGEQLDWHTCSNTLDYRFNVTYMGPNSKWKLNKKINHIFDYLNDGYKNQSNKFSSAGGGKWENKHLKLIKNIYKSIKRDFTMTISDNKYDITKLNDIKKLQIKKLQQINDWIKKE